MSGVRIGFLVAGAMFEFVGIVALAFPDAVPYALRFSQWQRKQTRALIDRIRRMLGRPRHIVMHASVGGTATVSGRASLIKSTGASTLEEKVAFLLTRD